MSYVIPSVLVYQQLASSGGVTNATPDLHACVIGPCYSQASYSSSTAADLIKTAAKSVTVTTASTTAASKTVTVVSVAGLSVGDTVLIEGAGASGGTLSAVITAKNGLTLTLDTAAVKTVASAVLTKKGVLSNTSVANTFGLPNVKPGQKVVAADTQIWLNNAKVQPLSTKVRVQASGNVLTVTSASTTATGAAAGFTLTLASAADLVAGDYITVAGAGTAGAALVAKIVDLNGTTATIDRPVVTAVTTAAAAKVNPYVLNQISNTNNIEAGDTISVAYTNAAGNAVVKTSLVKSLVTNGESVTRVTLVDNLPADIGATTTASTTTGSADITVASTTGLSVGKSVRVVGSSFDVTASVLGVAGSVVTLDANLTSTETGVWVYGLGTATIFVQKTFADQLLPLKKPYSVGNNYDLAKIATDYTFAISAGVELIYGPVVSADVHVSYRALRVDLSGSVMEIADPDDLEGTLGKADEKNPLALGVQICLANTVTSVRAVAVESDDVAGYQKALEMVENLRVYALVPLTQDSAITSMFKTHADQMSTAEQASWRVALLNHKIPTEQAIGSFTKDFVASGASIQNIAGKFVLNFPNGNFISDGATPGDLVYVTAGSPVSVVNTYTVTEVLSNQQLAIDATTAATTVSFYVSRKLSKTQQAAFVAATSAGFKTRRVLNIFPDTVGISVGGVTKYLPGYYLSCAIAGMTAGFPVQKGFTNVGLAGVVDLKFSNFYFTRAQLNSMAEAGTFLIVQDTQGGIPYVRHQLTTDMTVLEYREYSAVRNMDFLAYYFRDKLQGFIGTWNITSDTLNTVRQTVISSAELLKGKKVEKLGAPLLDYKIQKLEQDKNNKDQVILELPVSIPYALNYLNLYLIV